jgi:hypothetical protein
VKKAILSKSKTGRNWEHWYGQLKRAVWRLALTPPTQGRFGKSDELNCCVAGARANPRVIIRHFVGRVPTSFLVGLVVVSGARPKGRERSFAIPGV